MESNFEKGDFKKRGGVGEEWGGIMGLWEEDFEGVKGFKGKSINK